jgi:hypothetical protein
VGDQTGRRCTFCGRAKGNLVDLDDRISRQASHAGAFVFKDGVLLAAYRVRRPTKDANAVHAAVTAKHLARVVRDIGAIDVDDGVVFDLDTISAQEIREQADYPSCVCGSL